MDFLDFNLTRWLDHQSALYRRRGYEVSYLPFVYGADFLPVTNVAAIQTVTIDHDSDFFWCMSTASAFTAAGAGTNNPNATILITADSSQRQIMNQRTALTNIFGTGLRPHRLIKPMLLPAKTTLSVEAVTVTGADQNLRLSFIGVKAFTTRRAAA